MKRGYKRLLIFELIMFFIFIINSFFWNILGSYTTVIFLLVIIIIFEKLFGFERDKHRYTQEIIFDIIIFLLIFFLLYYLFGIVIGFVRTDNYYNLHGIVKIIIPITLTISLKEFLRYNLITKADGNKLLIILSVILFISMDITNSMYYSEFINKDEMFLFIALSLLPSISTNLVCSYLSYKVGYKPNLVFLIVLNLYPYLLPIIPNPNEYLTSLIKFLLPIILGYRLSGFFKLEADEEIERNYNKKLISLLIIPSIVVINLVYFTSGYFRYHAIAIASGSMEKQISKGDVVIIKKIENQYDELKKGQIIAYKYQGIIVVHRIVKILKDDGKYLVYTKGDANHDPDNYVVEQNTIIGTVKMKIPFVGLPTVWLNEL